MAKNKVATHTILTFGGTDNARQRRKTGKTKKPR
jgi:hypothetical protein